MDISAETGPSALEAVALHRRFFRSLGKLATEDRTRVLNTLHKLMAQPTGKGLRLHLISSQQGPLVSISAGMDIRCLGYIHQKCLVLFEVGHHDTAYVKADRGIPPRVSVGDRVSQMSQFRFGSETEQVVPNVLPLTAPPLQLRELEWLTSCKSEEDALGFISELPPGSQDMALEYYLKHVAGDRDDYFEHSQHIRVFKHDAELWWALAYPLDEWRVFLHPKQLEVVEHSFRDSLLIVGGPGTGKTVVLLHRARLALQQNPDAKCCVFTATEGLAEYTGNLFSRLTCGDLTLDVRTYERWRDVGGELTRYTHILFDEAQECPVSLARRVAELATSPSLTFAMDPAQLIGRSRTGFTPNSGILTHRMELEYTYRLTAETAQLVLAYGKWRGGLQTGSVDSVREDIPLPFPLRGPKPVLHLVPVDPNGGHLGYSDVFQRERIVQLLGKIYWELDRSYHTDESATVLAFPAHIYPSKDSHLPLFQDELRANFPNRRFMRAQAIRGLEFKAGVILGADAWIPNAIRHAGKGGFRVQDQLHLCELYIALSRFRDVVHLVCHHPETHALIASWGCCSEVR